MNPRSTAGPVAVDERATTVGTFLARARELDQRAYLHFHRDGAWRSMSWAEAQEGVVRVAAALVAAGVRRGDRVVIMSPNRHEWILCDLGIQAAGGVTVPIYPSLTAREASEIADDCGAALAIVGDADLAARLAPSAVARVVRMEPDVERWLAAVPEEGPSAEVWERIAALGRDDLATIVYTSGTTGRSKGVLLAHRNLVDMAASSLEAFALGPDDDLLSALPFAHVLERVSGVFVATAAGAGVWLSRGLDRLAEDLAEVRPTVMIGVPRLFEKARDRLLDRIAEEPAWKRRLFRWGLGASMRVFHGAGAGALARARGRLADRLVLESVRRRLTGGRLRFFISGGAPLSAAVEETFWSLGIPILQGWGMTELTSGATSNTETGHRPGTVGRPLPGVRVAVAEDGEVLVAGPGVTLGYHGNPAATAATIEDGWLKTGDLGTVDGAGFLRITGRKKELIKTAGGKMVAPLPVEARLEEDRLIESALLVGDERPFVTALIVPDWAALASRCGITGNPAELVTGPRVRELIQERVDRVNADLAGFESVGAFTLLAGPFSEAAGELTPTLKPKRAVILERHRTAIDAMYEAAAAHRAAAASPAARRP